MSARNDPSFGRSLARAREAAGLSVRELARRLGVSPATALGGERGIDLRLSTLRRWVAELPGLAADELLGRPAPSPPLASEAAFRGLRAAFGFSVETLRWSVEEQADGSRRTQLAAIGARPCEGRLDALETRSRLAHLLYRGSPGARSELTAGLLQLEAGTAVEFADACFTHRFERDRRGAMSYRREQGRGAPPVGFGTPGALSLSAPLPAGISLVVDLPARSLELVLRPATATRIAGARACAWAEAQPLAGDEKDLAPFLWPAGLAVTTRGGSLRVVVPHPELGLQHGLLWHPEGDEGEGADAAAAASRPSEDSMGATLAFARESAGLSLRELGRRLDVSPATIAGLERGQDPRRSLVMRLLEQLPELRPEVLLPIEPPLRVLSRRELWERQRALLGLEADEERKTLVVTKTGDAHAVCESLGLRSLRPTGGDLRLRYASASGGRLPTELREIEEAVAAETEESGLRTRVLSRSQGRVIHEVVVPAEQAKRGVSYSRRLFTAGFFDPEETGGHDGAAIVPFHPVRRLVLSVTLPRGLRPRDVRPAIHPRVLLDGPCPEADLASSLHSEGLLLEHDEKDRTLRLSIDYPLIGLLADLFWRRA